MARRTRGGLNTKTQQMDENLPGMRHRGIDTARKLMLASVDVFAPNEIGRRFGGLGSLWRPTERRSAILVGTLAAFRSRRVTFYGTKSFGNQPELHVLGSGCSVDDLRPALDLFRGRLAATAS